MNISKIFAGLLVAHFLTGTARCENWGQAAGPNGNFIVKGKAPLKFSITRDEAVLWRVPLPNTGQGSVVISGGCAFVASHAPTEGDSETGSIIIGQCFDGLRRSLVFSTLNPGTSAAP